MTRLYAHAEQGSEIHLTSGSWPDTAIVSLQFDAEPGKSYLIFWTGEVKITAVNAASNTSANISLSALGGDIITDRWIRQTYKKLGTSDGTEYWPLGSILLYRHTGVAGPVGFEIGYNFNITFASDEAFIRRCVLVALELGRYDTVGASQRQFPGDPSGIEAPTITAPGVFLSQAFPVLTESQRLFLGCASAVDSLLSNVLSLKFDEQIHYTTPDNPRVLPTTSEMWFRGFRSDAGIGLHGAKWALDGSDPTPADIESPLLCMVRLKDFDDGNHYYVEQTTLTGGTETSYTDAMTLDAVTAAGDHLVIAGIRVRNSSATQLGWARLQQDGVVLRESGVDHEGLVDADLAVFDARVVTLVEGSHNWTWQRKGQASNTTSADGFIIVIPLTFTEPAIVVDPVIPVSSDAIYTVDLTVAPVDLTATLLPARSPAIGVGAIGVGAIAAPAPAGLLPDYDDPVEEVRHFADIDWTTIPADGPAIFHDGRADNALEFERTVPLAPGSPRNTFGVGRVKLLNADQGLRDLALDYSIDGRAVEVLVGSPKARKATFERLFRGLADLWGGATATELTVELRDRWRLLATDPRPLFRGTGGGDGPPELQDKPVPLWLGWRSNVPLTFVTNEPFPIYLASGWPMDSYAYVRSRAGDIPIQGATTDIFNPASVPTLGQARVCVDNASDRRAYVGFASQPDGAVTAGGRGLAINGAYSGNMALLALWLQTELADIPFTDIDTDAWQNLYDRWSGEIGAWFGTEPTTALQMMAAVMHPATWWGDDTEGRVTCGTLDTPDRLGTPSGKISSDEIIDIERMDWPGGAPWKRARVLYDTNDFVQTTDLAEATADWLSYIKEPGRVYGPDNVAVRRAHAGAIDPDPVQTPFRLIYDAAEVQQIIEHLNSGAVDLWRVVTADDRVRFPIGHVLTLDDDQVASNGVPALVVGTSFSAGDARTTYLLVA